jgi:hypothetical protein
MKDMANLTNRIIWWALVASLLIYVGMARVVKLSSDAAVPNEILAIALAVISVIMGAGTLFYRRYAVAEPIQAGKLDPTTPDGLQRSFIPFIVNLVMSESIGVYGLVLALLSGNSNYSIAFSVPALILMYLHRPTAGDLVPPLGRYHSTSGSPPIA